MLTSLLPGLRELRTPLAVGYVWLFTLYLALADRVPVRDDARGLTIHLYRLYDVLGPSALLAVLTFTAYLVGSLLPLSLRPTTSLLRHYLLRLNASIRGRLFRRPRGIFGLLALLSEPLTTGRDDLMIHVRRRLDEIAREHGEVAVGDLAYALGHSEEDYRLTGPPGKSPVGMLVSAVLQEASDLRVRLQIASENLFQSYDRKQAEAQFRSRLAVPLLALAVTVANPQAIRMVAFVLLLAASIVLAVQGMVREADAESELIQVLAQGVITSPVLDRLEVAAQRRKAATPKPRGVPKRPFFPDED